MLETLGFEGHWVFWVGYRMVTILLEFQEKEGSISPRRSSGRNLPNWMG
jgi:hypothetical protein